MTVENSVYPELMGTEEETRGTLFEYRKESFKRANNLEDASTEIVSIIYTLIPPLPGNGIVSKGYLENGGRAYFDGRGVEVCTAESNTPLENTISINSLAEVYRQAVGIYLQDKVATDGVARKALLPRRVVNDVGVRWGVPR